MSLRLLFLGRLRDIAGADERVVGWAPRLAQVIAALEPELAQALETPMVRIAINGTLGDRLTLLADGDEIAFLPPVSGG
jgi:molybdopterin synthase sulfur carrier subunit